ncbi:MAG: prolipoprotein diacylglyceryl transferase, partial [Deltaproteobacteria bacterium]|nr:prolipoprotein diacylglyceryl transferase [Deltaproteobacteria bacterium]
HPSQLYEAALEGVILFLVLWRLKDLPFRPGSMICLFLGGYGILRFFAEFFREPDPQIGFILGFMTMGQVLCSAMIAAAIVLWFLLPKSPRHSEKKKA